MVVGPTTNDRRTGRGTAREARRDAPAAEPRAAVAPPARRPAQAGQSNAVMARSLARDGGSATPRSAPPGLGGAAAARDGSPAPAKPRGRAAPVAPTARGDRGTREGQPPPTEGAPGSTAPAPASGGLRPASVQADLLMPEPPTQLSKAERQRLAGVEHGLAATASAQAALTPAKAQVDDARLAVAQPPAEANAEAEADLVAALGERPAPSPELVQLCQRIKDVIRAKRPPDRDQLVKADPADMAKAAGQELDGAVQGDVQRVGDGYQELQDKPEAKPQGAKQPLPGAPAARAVNAPAAAGAAPEAIPAKDVSLNADVDANAARMRDAGMDSPAAMAVKSGPLAGARAAQADLQSLAESGPADALAGQRAALDKTRGEMASLQKSALAALTAERAGAVVGTGKRQHQMIGSEADMRAEVGRQATAIFTDAQTRVRDQLKSLSVTAMREWTDGVAILSTKFKASLKSVEDWIAERHSGAVGEVVSIWDDWTGLPSWVEDEYDKAEKKFGDGVCDLALKISAEVNLIVAACQAIIKSAEKRIADLYAQLPDSLKTWAEGELAGFHKQLEGLKNETISTRDNFNKDLAQRAGSAVQEAREQIAALRAKARGILGRAIDFINEFVRDPVRAIIDGLLELVGIPPSAFWAVVEKIKAVIGGIAEDPLGFAGNLLEAVGQGFSRFFDNIFEHLFNGLLGWLFSGLKDPNVQVPKDLSIRSIITFLLQLMGISWAKIRKLLVKYIGAENVALIEKAWSFSSMLIEKGVDGLFDLVQGKLNPREIIDQVIQAATDFLVETVVKQGSARILLLFNPVGAIAQAVEAIYRVLKWIFTNAAKLFRLVETVVNGAYDILKGNVSGMAKAVELALSGLIAPVIDFLADYIGAGDLPNKIGKTIAGFQDWIEGILDSVIRWLVEKGKALLKAVGLGKEKDKKDEKGFDGELGRVVKFTVKGESHRLWISVAGGSPVVMLASQPGPVAAALDHYEKLASSLEKEKRQEVMGLIASARALLGETKSAAATAKTTLDNPQAQPKEKKAADDAVEGKQEELVSPLEKLIAEIKAKTLGPGADAKPGDIILDTFRSGDESKWMPRKVQEVKRVLNGRPMLWARESSGKKAFFYDEYDKAWQKHRDVDIYDYLRAISPDKNARAYVRGRKWEDYPIYSEKQDGPLTVDHIIPVSKIATMFGPGELSLIGMRELANLKENFMGLGSIINSSRGDTSWENWQGLGDQPIPPSLRQRMVKAEKAAEEALKRKIAEEKAK